MLAGAVVGAAGASATGIAPDATPPFGGATIRDTDASPRMDRASPVAAPAMKLLLTCASGLSLLFVRFQPLTMGCGSAHV